MSESQRTSRKQQILETLAQLLESNPGERITTAGLAKAVGVSEAALYRHFPSKAKMFDALLVFVEESVFSLINRILEEEKDVRIRCEQTLLLLLKFSAMNPGITRILTGDALVGEKANLRARVNQYFDRLETQFKQILREGELHGDLEKNPQVSAIAALIIAFYLGRMQQFVQSGFKVKPAADWPVQWPVLSRGVFGVGI